MQTGRYEYRVVPFIGDVVGRDKKTAEKVAAQLNQVISSNIGNGWEFFRIDQVQILVRPGCLGGPFGAQSSTAGLDMIPFRRAHS
ncbi:MAG: hypothetical protein HYX89_02380 [Chloroflexi bacterium]|nr:hypothetical protein [Chloroflexota bacterium]